MAQKSNHLSTRLMAECLPTSRLHKLQCGHWVWTERVWEFDPEVDPDLDEDILGSHCASNCKVKRRIENTRTTSRFCCPLCAGEKGVTDFLNDWKDLLRYSTANGSFPDLVFIREMLLEAAREAIPEEYREQLEDDANARECLPACQALSSQQMDWFKYPRQDAIIEKYNEELFAFLADLGTQKMPDRAPDAWQKHEMSDAVYEHLVAELQAVSKETKAKKEAAKTERKALGTKKAGVAKRRSPALAKKREMGGRLLQKFALL